uniref:(northern house mosquito) hypothetical protein n=1 Tax=Culex pipiens TaxID=7175 RepID=A0A8D8A084_CULPI
MMRRRKWRFFRTIWIPCRTRTSSRTRTLRTISSRRITKTLWSTSTVRNRSLVHRKSTRVRLRFWCPTMTATRSRRKSLLRRYPGSTTPSQIPKCSAKGIRTLSGTTKNMALYRQRSSAIPHYQRSTTHKPHQSTTCPRRRTSRVT